MNKFGIVLGHTYFSRIKSKAFIITTVIVMLFMVGIANIDKIIDLFAGDDDKVEQIAVIDETESLFSVVEENFKTVTEDAELIQYTGDIEEGEKAVKADEYEALLVISEDDQHLPKATYISNSGN